MRLQNYFSLRFIILVISLLVPKDIFKIYFLVSVANHSKANNEYKTAPIMVWFIAKEARLLGKCTYLCMVTKTWHVKWTEIIGQSMRSYEIFELGTNHENEIIIREFSIKWFPPKRILIYNETFLKSAAHVWKLVEIPKNAPVLYTFFYHNFFGGKTSALCFAT